MKWLLLGGISLGQQLVNRHNQLAQLHWLAQVNVSTGGQAAIEVRNTVPSAGSQGGHGMALHNVRERLRLLHDVSAQLDCRFDGEVYRARIMLPL